MAQIALGEEKTSRLGDAASATFRSGGDGECAEHPFMGLSRSLQERSARW
jgi:hypothetical protein